MDYIKICKWEEFQHYKKRNPPWIKLHTSLLDNESFECLHDDSKVLLICLWLFAARKGNGEIPANIAYLKRKLPIEKKINLQPLIDAGFIEVYQNDSTLQALDDSNVLSSDRAEAETKPETETKHKKKVVVEFPSNLDTPEFKNTWKEWECYRTETKKKLTPSTVKKQLKMLSEYTAPEAVVIIEKSIRNGWQGLFPERNQQESPKQCILHPNQPGKKWQTATDGRKVYLCDECGKYISGSFANLSKTALEKIIEQNKAKLSKREAPKLKVKAEKKAAQDFYDAQQKCYQEFGKG